MHQENDESGIEVITRDAISTLHRCALSEVKNLLIPDLSGKLKNPDEYDIGGCYSPDPEFWFYFSTSICPGKTYLLNLFVRYRKVGNFSISISETNEVISKHDDIINFYKIKLSPKLKTYTFVSGAPDECHYIKTFCFSEEKIRLFDDNFLYIPLEIKTDKNEIAEPEFVKQIKLAHDFSQLLITKKGSDIVIKSSDEQRYECHKILLAAQSSVLKEMIKNLPADETLNLDIDSSDVSVLLEFIYKGFIQDVLKRDCFKLLELAFNFDVKGLISLIELALGELIDVKNAVAIAVTSEKYNLGVLQKQVFDFIKTHQAVQATVEFTELDDVPLIKKMLQHSVNRDD